MNYLIDWISDMLAEEEKGIEEYIDLANELVSQGIPKSVAEKVFRIAEDENRHKKILASILKTIEGV